MSSLVAVSSLKEFFRLLVGEVIARQRVTLAEITEFYVVNLLSEFAAAEKLFDEEQGGRKDHEPLALLYHRAMQQERDERIRTLRRIGDVALYKAGFFAEALRDRVVGSPYYIQMGSTAYGYVASLAHSSSYAAVYLELQQKFGAVVEVLEEIAARGMATTPQGAVKVFESWQRTGNGRLESVLVDAGLVPGKGGLAN